MRSYLAVLAAVATTTRAQFPSAPTDTTVITSCLDSNVNISYKELPSDFCETTEGARSFSGYVKLPQSLLQNLTVDFDINTFFLYFEARHDKDNAPLLIYLAGGPGESSTFVSMSGEGGPCYVNPDGNSTTLNEWSFNNHANVLYIDQPVSAGFSYTSLKNGTYNMVTQDVTPLDDEDGSAPGSNIVVGHGTFSDPTIWKTTNTSAKSAKALWHFAEHWLTQFPEYTSNNKKIGVWGNSHGGYWAPATAARFHKELETSAQDSPLREWSIDNVGITNGAIDMENDMPFWPTFLYNNTYTPLIDEDTWTSAQDNFTKADGCLDAIKNCRTIADELDPDGAGTIDEVNEACRQATSVCLQTVGGVSGQVSLERDIFDIAVPADEGLTPCPYYVPVVRYLNQDWTQQVLGVPLNFTYISNAVLQAYTLKISTDDPEAFEVGTGDGVRASADNLDYVLQNDIKVALVYGDRDARSPWLGAEALPGSGLLSQPGADAWSAAGYELIETDDGEAISTEKGGAVKQVGRLSFSRVFQAGHMVNSYSPETVHTIFVRTLNGTDVATGTRNAVRGGGNGTGYTSDGASLSQELFDEELPADEPGSCMVDGSFQEESVWTEIRAAAASLEGGDGATGEEESQSGSDESDDAENSASSTMRLGGSLQVLLVIGLGFGLVL